MKVLKSNINWYPWLKDFLKGLFEHPRNSTHTILSKRQVGKSLVSESVLLKFSIDTRDTFSIMIEPTLKQSRKVFKHLVKGIEKSPVFAKANESLLEITFVNGSTIQFLSAEQGEKSVRGYTVTGILIIDEAAFIPDDIYEALLATTNVHRAPIMIVSTPRFRLGFFYDAYTDGLSNTKDMYSYNWGNYDTSALLDADRLEYYRKKLPRIKFEQEFLGLFCDAASSIFGNFKHVLSNEFTAPIKCFMGIDWGSGLGQDSTAISIFNENKQLIYLEYFNDKDETQTIKRIIELVQQYHPVKIEAEKNGLGVVYCGLLEKAIKVNGISVNFRKFITTNDSKAKLISKLLVGILNSELQLLNDEVLIKEMTMYEMTLSHTGKLVYNAKKGFHDDTIIATVLSLDAASSGSYSIS